MSADAPIGLVVVLRDEVHDIAAWLAWHVALGFDTIFAIDDGSIDGTDRVIKAAGRLFDIRYSKAVQDHPFFYERQQREYRRKLAELSGSFSWLCFLDADEYLRLSVDADISSFLARFPDAGGVALNWRLHGNNGHVLRPPVPPPMAYPKRSSIDLWVNHHVKSIVRPDQVGHDWQNVHCFDVRPEAYVDAEGRSIRWSDTRGIVSTTPSYGVAHVMHFQNRSMEHFIDRAGKRRDTHIDARTWSNDDWNREEDEMPSHVLVPMLNVLARIELEVSLVLSMAIRSYLRMPNFGGRHDPAPPPCQAVPDHSSVRPKPTVSVCNIRTHHGTFLRLDPSTSLVVHGEDGSDDLLPLFLIRSSHPGTDALLVAGAQEAMPLRLIGSRQAAVVIRLIVTPAADGQVTLQTPETALFLAAEPTALSGHARRVAADRREPQIWEMFTLSHALSSTPAASVLTMMEAYFSLVRDDIDLTRLGTWLIDHKPAATAPVLQILLRRLGRDEHLRLVSHCAGLISPELLSGSAYS